MIDGKDFHSAIMYRVGYESNKFYHAANLFSGAILVRDLRERVFRLDYDVIICAASFMACC